MAHVQYFLYFVRRSKYIAVKQQISTNRYLPTVSIYFSFGDNEGKPYLQYKFLSIISFGIDLQIISNCRWSDHSTVHKLLA